jgi:hypothetical protein
MKGAYGYEYALLAFTLDGGMELMRIILDIHLYER